MFLVHGWSGRGTQLGGFVEPLLRRGYSVVTWDALGHGASPGRSSSLVETVDGLFAMARHLRSAPHAIVAHSMGAAATGIALSEGLDAQRVVQIAPPASLADFVRRTAGVLGFDDGMRSRVQRSLERRFAVSLDALDVEHFDVPLGERTLIVHDEDDRDVPIEHGLRVADAIGAASFVRTAGLGHRRVLRDRTVLRKSAAWITAQGGESSERGEGRTRSRRGCGRTVVDLYP